MLDGIPFADLTAPTLLGITVLLLLLGKLVPRSTLMDKAEEAEKWRKAYEIERETRISADAQTIELLEFAKTTNAIVVATFGSPYNPRQQSEGEPRVVSTPTSQ